MPINTLMYIYIYFYHMLHHSYDIGNTGTYKQNCNNGTDTETLTVKLEMLTQILAVLEDISENF